ncbi:MAG: SAM-dependent methyltransferase [Prevotella sp.]|nr:SAM-dependent methyltransferase [Prevotella sp.]
MTTSDFISSHANDDVRALALKAAGRTDIDLPFALDQIAGRQTARRKLPSWAATEGITYPPHISMEQCSSEQTALYKADIAGRIAGGGLFIDITGGFGVDFSFIARRFERAVYIERQEHLCAIAKDNFRLLGLSHAETVNGDGTEYIKAFSGGASLVFIDPARRDNHGGRTFAISDCTPDILNLMDTLLDKAGSVMIKLSPMLDWHKAVEDIEAAAGRCVSEVHIVSVGNECKELLVVVTRRGDGSEGIRLFCTDDDSIFVSEERRGKREESLGSEERRMNNEESAAAVGNGESADDDDDFRYLYEPNASIMKAGCFGAVARRYGVRQIDTNSHLFVSGTPVAGFPGRRFAVQAVTGMNRKELKAVLAGTDRANITVRNFPLTVAELRKRLKIKEGGSTYIFATTLPGRKHVLLFCHRLGDGLGDDLLR